VQKYRLLRAEYSGASNSRSSDCFHDGKDVIPVVRLVHESLLRNLRESDYVTEAVLSMVLQMLEGFAQRPDAEQLWIQSRHILQDAGKKLQYNHMKHSPSKLSLRIPDSWRWQRRITSMLSLATQEPLFGFWPDRLRHEAPMRPFPPCLSVSQALEWIAPCRAREVTTQLPPELWVSLKNRDCVRDLLHL
jgi:hypothetical protein